MLAALGRGIAADAAIVARIDGEAVLAIWGLEEADARFASAYAMRAAAGGGSVLELFPERDEALPASCVAVADSGIAAAFFRRAGAPALDERDAAVLTGFLASWDKPKEAGRAELWPAGDRLGAALEAGGLGVWQLDPEHQTIELDAVARAAHSVEADQAVLSLDAFLALISPLDAGAVHETLLGHRERGPGDPLDYRLASSDGTQRWLRSRGLARLDPDLPEGEVVGIVFDVTQQKEAEERQRLLTQELSHRVKNILQLVRSIADLAGRRAHDVDAFRESFRGRIDALAAAHDQIVSQSWTGANAAEVARCALRPLQDAGQRVEIDIAPIELTASAAQLFALLVHELATNAVKYGALSVPEGRVGLVGKLGGGGDALLVEWHERDGPPIAEPPEASGFGLLMLERASRFQRGGETVLDWRPDGLFCGLVLPRG